jgi:pimeloyl-ACP methyl ester carboxylesterase
MPYLAVDDLTLHYEAHGPPEAPVLVLLHGFNSSGSTAWRDQVPVFGARYRLLIPDWRGHGRTDNPAGPAAMNHRRFARDAAAFCRALGVTRAAFWGHSSGAMQLLSLALDAPELVEALVLCAGSHAYPDELRTWWRTLTPEAWVAPERRPGLQARHTAMGPDQWRALVAAWIALGEHAHDEDFPRPEALRGIAAPALILHGDRDRFFPVEMPLELYRLLPDAELCILPRTGHGVPAERPAWTNAIVLDFLTRRATFSGAAGSPAGTGGPG